MPQSSAAMHNNLVGNSADAHSNKAEYDIGNSPASSVNNNTSKSFPQGDVVA